MSRNQDSWNCSEIIPNSRIIMYFKAREIEYARTCRRNDTSVDHFYKSIIPAVYCIFIYSCFYNTYSIKMSPHFMLFIFIL